MSAVRIVGGSHPLALGRSLVPSALATMAAAAPGGLAAANGGYWPTSWGWSALALAWVALLALILKPMARLGRLEAAFAWSVVGIAAWTWLSVAWSSDRTSSVLEGERSLVLVGGIAALVTLAGGRPVRQLLGGLLTGIVIVSSYALATRLFPDRTAYDPLAGYRLATPIGYWNGLGVYAAIGSLLAVGVAARAQRLAARIAAAVSLLALVPTLYFTFSRGAWLALAVGVVVLVALDPRRLQGCLALALLAPAPALAVYLASRSHALTHPHSALARAAHDGHHLAVVMLVLAAVQASLAGSLGLAEATLTPPRWLRRIYASALILLLLAALAAAGARYGSPITAARHAYHSFAAPQPAATGDLNQRLFSLSGDGRWSLWVAAWNDARAHPLLGAGAGTYAEYWAAHRPSTLQVEDAHNLYLETLAELGPLGLALVVALIAIPLAGAVRHRRHPLVPSAAAAFAAYAVHAAADWDWELSGVTLTALLTGAACVLAGRESAPPPPRLRPSSRTLLGAGLATVAAAALVGLVANEAAARSGTASGAGNWRAAAADANTVIRWSPWSAVGWQERGEAELVLGERPAARRDIEQAIAKQPDNWVLWLDLSSATSGAARSRAFARALELDPRSSELALFKQAYVARKGPTLSGGSRGTKSTSGDSN